MEDKRTIRDNEMLRLTVMALLVGIMFGVLQYYGDKTFNSAGMDVILKVVAISFFNIVMPCFIFYLMFLGFDLRYDKEEDNGADRFRLAVKKWAYNLGIWLLVYIVVLTLTLVAALKILILLPNFPILLILLFILGAVIAFSVALWSHFKRKRRKE